MIKKALLFGIVLIGFTQPLAAFGAAVHPAFNANRIVPDSVFSDTKTFGAAADIQKFLEFKGSVLADTGRDFLLKLHEPDDAFLKESLGDPAPNRGAPRTAAELIWDASQATGLNPQVILVTLNKEQGLITTEHSGDRLQRALDHSMGFACPDGGGCDGTLSGFYFQLFGNLDGEGSRYIGAAKSLMRSFNTVEGRGPTLKGRAAQVGDTITLTNTLGGFEGVEAQQTLTIENRATAALYRYTPHVFNGNYNFWRFFTSWFKYPNGTIIKDTATGIIYLIQKDSRRQLPSFVAHARHLKISNAVTASPTELANYPIGELYGPADKTIILLDGKTYLFLKNIKYPASPLVLKQKKLNPMKAVRTTLAEAALFASGPVMLPKDGTVLRAKGKNAVYLMQKGALQLFGTLTLNQYRARNKVKLIPESELASYPRGGYVAPRDGTLVRAKGKAAIYLVMKSEKQPLPNSLFINLKYKKGDVKVLSEPEVAALPLGKSPTPVEGTYFKVRETKEVYLFKNRKVHKVAAAVVKKRRIKTHFTFEAATAADWVLGDPITR